MKPDSSLNQITLTMKQNDVDSVDGRFCSQRKTSKPALTLMIAVLNQWPDIAA
jgi:hypothetical protein